MTNNWVLSLKPPNLKWLGDYHVWFPSLWIQEVFGFCHLIHQSCFFGVAALPLSIIECFNWLSVWKYQKIKWELSKIWAILVNVLSTGQKIIYAQNLWISELLFSFYLEFLEYYSAVHYSFSAHLSDARNVNQWSIKPDPVPWPDDH